MRGGRARAARYDEARERRDRMNSMATRVAALTPREREVFELMVRGKLNKQICYQLGTSERTVKAHRHAIMEKLEVHSLAEAVSVAERLGMVDNAGMMQGTQMSRHEAIFSRIVLLQ